MTAEATGPGVGPSPPIQAAPIQITIVRSPGCHFCTDAEEALVDLAAEYPVSVELVEISSGAGRQLVMQHRPAMNPLVLIEGDFFSAGRLPRKKLAKLLDSLLPRITARED